MSEQNTLPLYQAFSNTSLTNLFSDTWRMILLGWRTFVPMLLVLAFTSLARGASDSGLVRFGGTIGPWVAAFAYLVLTALAWLTEAAMIVAADAVSEWRSLSLRGAYAAAARRFWRYLVTLALLSLIVLEGGLLFVIPGLLLQLALFPALYAVLIEGLGPREALARSRFLTTGSKAALLVRVLAFWFFCMLLFWIPPRVVVGRPDWRWINLPPMNAHFSAFAGDAPDPAWFPYVAAFGGALWALLFGTFMVLVFKGLRSDRGPGLTPAPAWPAIIFIVIGIVLALVSLPSYIETRHFVARAVPATGALLGPVDTAESDWSVTRSYPVAAEFTAPDGITRQITSSFYQAGVTDRPRGSPVAVLFEPENPSDARIAGILFVWGGFALKLLLGGGLLLVGLAQWIYLRRTIAADPPASAPPAVAAWP